MADNLVSNVKAFGGKARLAVQWNNPTSGSYDQINIIYKAGGFPSSSVDGSATLITLTATEIANAAVTFDSTQLAYYTQKGETPPDCIHVITGLTEGTFYGVGVFSRSGVTDGGLVNAPALEGANPMPGFGISSTVFATEDYSTPANNGWKLTVTDLTSSRVLATDMVLPADRTGQGEFTLSVVDMSGLDVVFPKDVVEFLVRDALNNEQFRKNYIITEYDARLAGLDGFFDNSVPPIWTGYAVQPAIVVNLLPPPPIIDSADNPSPTSDITPLFVWHASLDPEGSKVDYAIEIDSVMTFDSGIDHKLFKSLDAADVGQFEYDLNGDNNWQPYPVDLLGVVGNANTKIRFTVPNSSFLSEKTWYWRVYATDHQLA